MLFPFRIFIIVAHSLAFVCSQLTLNESAIALPLSAGGFTATTSNATDDWYNTNFACYNGGTGSPATRPKLLECTNALFIMPQDDTVSIFRSGEDASDKYQLPKSFQCLECKITISMFPTITTEGTSWHRIGLDATRLVLSCNGPSVTVSQWRTGGHVRTGASRGILISVYKAPWPPSEADEDTMGMMNGSSITADS
ncbi:hypothetical protein JMJ35_009229 [Cladonia borealis]|uniref:Uncharacterized protein n=1 Tax=Cladonia borealis TaxID=184061 RepID=A0AA39QU74_9LECA|nr:hypothetical protein JMJ35_009229 [Cladonia borealis]